MSINTIGARVALNQISQKFVTFGLDLPPALVKDAALIADQLDSASFALDARQLTDAVADALAAGKDPAADPKVQTLVCRQQLTAVGIERELMKVAEERKSMLLAKHADALVAGLSTVVEAAGEVLREAYAAIPSLDLDLQFVHTLAANQMTMWGRAREAHGKILQVAQTWTMLMVAAELVRIPADMRPLLLADLDAAQLAALGHQPQPEAVADGEHTLALADAGEFRRRVEKVEAQRAEAAQKAEDQQRTAGFGRQSFKAAG